jgi:hypothetical protein
MTETLDEVLRAIADDPCADCGQPLGDSWAERYNPRTDRLEKVHA